MSVIIVNSIATDSLRQALPDSIWVANFPEPSIAAALAPWVSPFASAILAAAGTLLIARHMYKRGKRDEDLAKHRAAFALMSAICDEMRRTRRRVLDMLVLASKNQRMQGPILTDAKDTLLGRLAESVPAEFDLHHIFRYYEILSFVAVHHNASIEVADVSGLDALRVMIEKRASPSAPEDPAATDYRRQSGFHGRAVAFACAYFDPDDGDGLTQHYVAGLEQLVNLAQLAQVATDERFTEPTEAEIMLAKRTIKKLTTKRTDALPPDPSEIVDDGL